LPSSGTFQEMFVESFQWSGNPVPGEIPLSPEPRKWVHDEVSSWAKASQGRAQHSPSRRRMRPLLGMEMGSLLLKCRIKIDVRGRKICLFHKFSGLGGSMFPVHSAIFPLNGQGAFVADVIQGPDDFLKLDPAVPQ
jgi:hypothetical protein